MPILRRWIILLVICMGGAVLTVGAPRSSTTLDRKIHQQVQQSQASNTSGERKTQRDPSTTRSAPDSFRIDSSIVPSRGRATTPRTNPAHAAITKALDEVRLKLNDPNIRRHVIPFDNFKNLNTGLTQKAESLLSEWETVNDKIFGLIEANSPGYAALGILSSEQKRPDYAQETQGIPFIYLSDASGHETQSIVREVQHVMESVRKANPQARILLALEFAVMTDFSTPIRFAGKPNQDMIIQPPYDQLVPLADQLNMDILSLDDYIWEGTDGDTGDTVTKLGEDLIILPEPFAVLKEKQELFTKYYGFLSVSTLGMVSRNRQWISYLKAVKPFYDIVIVYAGGGHIDSPNLTLWDIPVQIGEEHVIFNFYTLEENKEADKFVNDTYQILCDEKACVLISVPQEEEEEITESEWGGTEVIYEKFDYMKFVSFIETLPPATLQEIKGLMKLSDELGKRALLVPSTATFKAADPRAIFDVYLPDVSH